MNLLSKLTKFFYLTLFFLTPLVFTSFNSELFELPKMYLIYSLTLVILTLHLLNWTLYKTPLFRKTFLNIPLILFLATQIISTIISVDPHTSIFGYYSRLNGGLLSLICYLILFWVLGVYIDDKFKKNIINISLLTGFLVAAFGIAEHFGIDKDIWVQDVQSRVFSTLGQPNWLAAYLCILLPFSFHKFIISSQQKKLLLSTFYFLLFTSYFICLLFTKSKSGIIAAIISLGIYFIFTFIKKPFGPKFRTISLNKGNSKPPFLREDVPKGQVGLIIILLIILSLFISNPIKDKLFPKNLETSNSSLEINNLNITPSEDIRKIVWKGSLDLWKKFPFFGTGTETFAYSYYWTRPVEHNLTSEWDFLYNKAHNEYLNYLATTGSFGFLSYLFIIFSVLYLIFKKSSLEIRNWSLVIFSSFLSILITNFAGFSIVITSLYFFLLPTLLFDPLEIKTKPAKKSIFLPILTIFIFMFLFSKNIFYYLADITYAQSENYDAKNDYVSAFETINLSLNYRPNEPLYLNKYSLLASKLAITTKSEDYLEKAISASNQSINISPANTNFWKERSQMYYYLSSIDSKYFQESINSLLKVILLAPTDAKSYFLLGQFLETANLKKEAASYYQKAIDLKPNYDHAYFQLAQIYLEQKDYSKAKIYLESTTKHAPNNIDAKTLLDQIKKIK